MRKKLSLLSLLAVVGCGAYFVSEKTTDNNNPQSYSKKGLSAFLAHQANDAQEWLKARYIDVQTGEVITADKLEAIRTQIDKMDKNKSINFIDLGPDNIGGRTRAICIDRTEPSQNILWAGGVSGGLFYSWNKGNTWTRVESYADAGASPNISSMTMTIDGTLYVATGSKW